MFLRNSHLSEGLAFLGSLQFFTVCMRQRRVRYVVAAAISDRSILDGFQQNLPTRQPYVQGKILLFSPFCEAQVRILVSSRGVKGNGGRRSMLDNQPARGDGGEFCHLLTTL